MSTGLDGIFQPSLRHWHEYIESERMRMDVKPALDYGPEKGPVSVNLITGEVVFDQEAVAEEVDLRQRRRDGTA